MGYENIPAELKKYAQRFKPELVSDEQNATHVAIKGKFTDHQKHVYDVTYKIYLGKDNYGDFNIIRNTHYNNVITIRGVDNSDDQSADYNPSNPDHDAPISIDHRVTINRTTPLVVGLRRETLLDAHIEVRPLRLHLSGGDNPPTEATVTLVDSGDGLGWIGMERSGSTVDHITDTNTPSYGKRRYFTTNLISSLSGNTSLDVDNLSYGANQTIWLYIDENLTTSSRSAILRIEYDYEDPDTGEIAAPVDYVINQHGLYEVHSDESNNTYYIERFEEYLYNYDVEDLYGQTKEEGMPWGLNGVPLSNKHKSFNLNEDNDAWNNFVNNTLLPTYDFYLEKHDGFATESGGVVHNFAGQEFTSEIASNSNAGVKYLTMAQQASGAVEYCYNRNKRKSDGTIVKVEWYLPSADELEDIMIAGYSSFEEFQENYYWVSQPAYIRNIFYYEYTTGALWWQEKTTSATPMYIDNTEYARATKVVNLGNDQYSYAKSGLKEEPDNFEPRTESGYTNLGCFYEMPRWKNGTYDIATKSTENPNSNPPKVVGSRSGDERYTDTNNGDKRYFVHLGHLDDLMQEGYQLRTKNNRVRCAYRKIN